MLRSVTVLGIVGLIGLTSAATERAVLPVTRDVGITSVVGKCTFSNGAGPSAALRQNQNWSGFENKTLLMAFDTSLIKGWTVDKAYLHLTMAKGELYGAGLCTVLAPWVEGGGKNYLPRAGASCWDYARCPAPGAKVTDANYWAGPGSKLFTVAWGHPHIRYSHARGAQLKRGRTPDGRYATLRIAVKPELVAALATGACYGLVLTDDKGQVAEGYSLLGTGKPYRYNAAEDIWVFTRESQDAALRPRLEVIGRLVDKTPPARPANLKVAGVSASEGRVTLSFKAPGDDGMEGTALAYDVTYVALPG
ncbi:MAG: hypothetical protein J7M14_01960, partial [Planctomycetes bacterium]|nr:hypothetical protein [Planctomycetota bacterium]